ncbi:MAG: hypothetical protein HQL58_01535 [Magnetococcales bacterium]|nr:hypothetical protein [Magnetococcales bacterium]
MGRTKKVLRDETGRYCCPHCQQQLLRWEAAQHDFEDGLGFCVSEMLVCFNDQCSMYIKGWNSLFDHYGRVGSVRYYYSPEDGEEGVLPVAHRDALRGDVVGEQVI